MNHSLRVLVPTAVVACVAALLPPRSVARAADEPLLGFVADGGAAERALEARFDATLTASDLEQWTQRLAGRPHHIGSPQGKDNAEFMAALFRSWGYDTAVERFDVLFPTPRTRVVEMVAPTRFRAALSEPPVPGDRTSGQTAEQLPVYNAYSTDGDVTGELVYVNYGVPRDYEELARRGVEVKGRIVIARYGGSWRGIKPKVAAEHGAIGCLIYSDPREDGYFEGDVYPTGAWRNEHGAQRGSVADMPLYPGDPLTPGVGATPEAKRLPREQAATITRIPVLPLSHGDALPLLRALAGPMAPEAWRGALPIPYHLGPGPARVHLQLAFDWRQVPAYDVIARLPGAERPDEWVIRGNHHDAWVNGAQDPVSGLVAMLEEARGVGTLVKGGWRPKRTIVYAAWDGEEPGLLGSTEWVEAHAEELRRKAVAYVNSDSVGRGFLDMDGAHSLEPFVNQVARDVTDPETGVSVAERERARRVVGTKGEALAEARDRRDLRIGALGSGSDFTPFLQHVGVAALNIGYGGEDEGGTYHSIYDSYDHYKRFGDPKFEYGVTLAKTGGRAVLRLAEADVIPVSPSAFAEALGRYVKELATLTDDMREESAETSRRVRERAWVLAADPTRPFVAPTPAPPVPYLNFAPLLNALAQVQESARGYDRAWAAAIARGPVAPETQRALDEVLRTAEQALTRPEGLPRRPWFVHQVYAPGFYTGYGVKTIPGVREAIEERDWEEAARQVDVVAATLMGYAAHLDRATAVLAVP